VGLPVFLIVGLVSVVVFQGGAQLWFSAFALGCAVANSAAFLLRRRAGASEPPRPSHSAIRRARERFGVGAVVSAMCAAGAFLAGMSSVGFSLVGVAVGCSMLSLTYRRWV
jgi:hypothetical protein